MYRSILALHGLSNAPTAEHLGSSRFVPRGGTPCHCDNTHTPRGRGSTDKVTMLRTHGRLTATAKHVSARTTLGTGGIAHVGTTPRPAADLKDPSDPIVLVRNQNELVMQITAPGLELGQNRTCSSGRRPGHRSRNYSEPSAPPELQQLFQYANRRLRLPQNLAQRVED